MKTITVEAEVDVYDVLSEVETKYLVEELKERVEYTDTSGSGIIKLNSIQDQIKFEALKEKFYDIPESELDEFLRKY